MKQPGRSDRKSKFPYKYREGQHEVSHATATRYRKRAKAIFGKEGTLGQPMGYHRAIFQKILDQPDCQGIRFYPGLDDEGRYTLLFAGFDSKGNNILRGTIGDTPYRCPPFCPPNGGGILS